MTRLRYSNFADRIDIDDFEVAIGFDPDEQDRKGNDIGRCPLPWGLHAHGDTTGKFAIHRDKRVYNCWVCGGGSLLDLAMAMNDQTEEEALDWLFQFTKPVEETGEKFKQRIQDKLSPKEKQKFVMPYYNPRILEKWMGYDPWFGERGITEPVVNAFKLGFAEDAIKYAPKKGGVPIDEPYRGPAIILPHFFNSQLVGWQHRWLDDDRPKWCNKYTNTNDFPRQETLWGYDWAKSFKAMPMPVVVESVPTAAFLIGLGYPSLCTFGSAVNDGQLRLLRGFSQGVRLAPDKNDEGKYWKAAGELQRYVPVAWIDPPDELEDREDLGDLVTRPHLIHNCIEEAHFVSKIPKGRAVKGPGQGPARSRG